MSNWGASRPRVATLPNKFAQRRLSRLATPQHCPSRDSLTVASSQHRERARGAGPILPFGTFYGRPERRQSAPGLEVAVLDADPHRVVERHAHEEPHFVLVLEGLYLSTAADAPAVSVAPLLVYNPAGTVHRDRFEVRESARGRRFEGRFLTLSIDSALADAAAADGRLPPVATAVADPEALAIARRLAHVVSSAEPHESAMRPESLALALVACTATCRSSGRGSPPRWLAAAREQLDDRCGEAVSIAELARGAGVHPVHLARVFRQHLGCTPGDYLRRRRLDRAAVLLRETRRPLSDIALHCGFGDQSHFANAFKRYRGVTAGEYRRGG